MSDEYTDGWLSSGMVSGDCYFVDLNAYFEGNILILTAARSFLDKCSSGEEDPIPCPDSAKGMAKKKNSQSINILVTSGSLIPSIAKCLLFRFNGLIKHRDGK